MAASTTIGAFEPAAPASTWGPVSHGTVVPPKTMRTPDSPAPRRRGEISISFGPPPQANTPIGLAFSLDSPRLTSWSSTPSRIGRSAIWMSMS